MTDRAKVIKGINVCFNWQTKCSECPYNDIELVSECTYSLGNDTINLLKEQEEQIARLNTGIETLRKKLEETVLGV